MTAGEDILSMAEAEALSGISAFYLRRAMREGLVQCVKRAGGVTFTQSEVALWQAHAPALIHRLQAVREKHYLRKADYVPRHDYILPFRGVWLAGGTHLKHCTRYAWDFAVVDPADYRRCHLGMTEAEILKLRLRRDGNHNPRDFLCYGLDILAPADGVILDAPEPGSFANDNADGEGTIVIDHGGREYSRLCHVLGRSIRVWKGDRVSQGQVLSLAGGKHGDGVHQPPHLHWDLWDHPHFLFAKGIPMQIAKAVVYKSGQFERRYRFYLRAGMLVANL